MKLNIYAVTPLVVALSINDVSAESLRGHRQQRNLGVGSSAYHNGKGKAAKLWNRGNYNCDFRSITTSFIPDVKDSVYDECEYTYWLSSSSQRDCQKGAIDWATEKSNSCTSVVDCADVGKPIADGITNEYCPMYASYSFDASSKGGSRPKLIPTECKKVAKKNCISEAYRMVGERVDDNMCGSITSIWKIDYDKIEDKCNEEVSKLVKDVNSDTRHEGTVERDDFRCYDDHLCRTRWGDKGSNGFEFDIKKGISQSECASRCKSKSSCRGYEYRSDDRACELWGLYEQWGHDLADTKHSPGGDPEVCCFKN